MVKLKRRRIATIVVLVLSLTSCAKEPRGGPRVPTSPISGTVLVDGVPAAALLVTCHPMGDSPVPTKISAFTDQEGRFSVGTYESGDGAPAGEYQLTFLWGQWNFSGRYGGPDKLKDKYVDPETSKIIATVVEGLPSDLGQIELTTGDTVLE